MPVFRYAGVPAGGNAVMHLLLSAPGRSEVHAAPLRQWCGICAVVDAPGVLAATQGRGLAGTGAPSLRASGVRAAPGRSPRHTPDPPCGARRRRHR